MFYLGELAALIICWLFYCEFYWMIERKVRRSCSREYLRKRLRQLPDRLFFTPVSGKAELGFLYYTNLTLFWTLAGVTVFHLLLGWIGVLQMMIRIVTTLLVLVTGAVGASCSAGSTEYVCINRSISDKTKILALQILSFVSELLLILIYLYFAWAYIA
jgi:hypothetical protein